MNNNNWSCYWFFRFSRFFGVFLFCFLLAVPLVQFQSEAIVAAESDRAPELYSYKIVDRFPQNIEAFTQGLKFVDGYIYLGTGKRGFSGLTQVRLADGYIEKQVELEDQYFGEGIEIIGNQIFQLTWQANKVFVFDKSTFEMTASFSNPTEGWGLAYDGVNLLLSDGSSTIRRMGIEDFSYVDEFEVTLAGMPVRNLNELEYIAGELWANVWQTNYIVRINPNNGNVRSVIDLTGLEERTRRNGADAVLNGIAWDDVDKRLFVTGKYWSDLFEIEIVKTGKTFPQ